MPLLPVSTGDPHVPAHNAERDAINTLEASVATRIPLPPGAQTGDLLRWDGTQWLTTETRFFEGEGSPNGVVSAPVGSRYIDKIAAQGAIEWVKRTGTGNTGWITIAGDSGWLDVGSSGNAAFLNSWTNFNGPGGWSDAGYRKINGIVYLKGLVTRAAARNVPIFQLPAGFRPIQDSHYNTTTQAVDSSDHQGINILTTGMIQGRVGTPGYVGLDGVTFPADN